jgi:hypothetical protein
MAMKATDYDGCFLTELPNATTWQDLHARLLACLRMEDLPRPGTR